MICSLYITARDKKEAQKIARHLLGKRLIACANIFPVESMYWWKGKIAEEKEYAIIAKTNANVSAVEKEVRKIHSYETPCICKFSAQANKDYEGWVKKETKQK